MTIPPGHAKPRVSINRRSLIMTCYAELCVAQSVVTRVAADLCKAKSG